METEMDSVHREDACTNTTHKVHTFYFVKYPTYKDPLIMSKIQDATLEIQRNMKETQNLKEELRKLSYKKRRRLYDAKYCQNGIDCTKADLVLMKKFLKKDLRKMDMRFHSPAEEQLYDSMNELKHSLKNKRLSSNEEKRLMKEMKELQVEMEKAKSDDSSKLKKDQEWEKCRLESTIKWINWRRPKMLSLEKCFEAQTNQLHESLEKLKKPKEDLKILDRKIKKIQKEMNVKSSKVGPFNKVLLEYKKIEDDAMEKFFTQWREHKAFKEDYERRVLDSLESRGLNQDGTSAITEEIMSPLASDLKIDDLDENTN
ncbi:hypothetical protein LUZ60_012590 [Juncus effusus]|nr:hypothetical protein LUZ60_012590 [Juncus effusus]